MNTTDMTDDEWEASATRPPDTTLNVLLTAHGIPDPASADIHDVIDTLITYAFDTLGLEGDALDDWVAETAARIT